MKLENLKKILFITFYLSLFVLMLGCSTKTTPVYTVIKTPKFKAAEQGFLEKGAGYEKLIIYKAGSVPVEITVKNSYICINSKCIDKEKFMKLYMPAGYPSDFFDKILNKECIKGYFCKSEKNKILFKDRKNRIIIMIKEID